MENKQTSLNYALHPKLVETGQIQLQEVYEVTVQENKIKHEEGSAKVDIHRRGIFLNGEFDHWEVPYCEVTSIITDGLVISTHNGFKYEGKQALNKVIIGLEINVLELIKSFLSNRELQQQLFSSEILGIDEFLSAQPQDFNYTTEIELKHGYQIDTIDGGSCISFMHIPLTWRRSYKPTMLPIAVAAQNNV